MSEIKVSHQSTTLVLNTETLGIEITAHGETWRSEKMYQPHFYVNDKKIYFHQAGKLEHFSWNTGVGCGIRSVFSGFHLSGKEDTLSFQTVIWIEYATEDIFFELNPLTESEQCIGNFYWPGQMEFRKKTSDWYTVITNRQGLLIPNDWKYDAGKIVFDGQMCSAGAFMPWFGQLSKKKILL